VPEAPAIDPANTVWLLVSTALVLLMTPGLALFYGGLNRSKGVLNMMMMSFSAIGLISVLWLFYGFSLAFGSDQGGIIGNIGDYLGTKTFLGEGDLWGATAENPSGIGVPIYVFMAFQMVFAVITVALISGAISDRTKFAGWLLFAGLWGTLVYFPVAHWVWGGGWIGAKLHALDFAGGTAVHINAGAAALGLVLALGKRVGWPREVFKPHNVPFVALGAGLLWFGWFGFNAGSELAADGIAANALLVTNTAAAAAMITWVFASYLHKGKVSVLGAACGAVAGLVAITPASGFVTAGGAIVIGLAAGGICYSATLLRERIKIDDALDVFAVHGVGGTFGAIATGIFATTAINFGSGLIDGNAAQVVTQLVAVGASIAYAVVATFVIVKVTDLVLGIRVKSDVEELGLDLAVHGEVAYQS